MATKVCWGCNRAEGAERFKACSKCRELKIVPSLFCSKECQITHWPRHMAWHKEQKRVEESQKGSTDWDRSDEVNALEAMKTSGNDGKKLCAEAITLFRLGKYAKAAKLLKKLVTMPHIDDDTMAIGYDMLGNSYGISGDHRHSLECYLEVMTISLHTFNTDQVMRYHYYLSFAKAYLALLKPELVDVPRPHWWNDKDLLRMSKAAVDMQFDDSQASNPMKVRASILMARAQRKTYGMWDIGERVSADYREAAACYRRLAELEPVERAMRQEGFLRDEKAALELGSWDPLELELELELDRQKARTLAPQHVEV